MPTMKPRVQVTLKREVYDCVSRLAKLQRRSRSAVLSELVTEILPVLQRVVVVLEAAQHAQRDLTEGLRRSAAEAEAEILPYVTKALGQFDWLTQEAVKELGGEMPPQAAASPRPPNSVTRGSGHTRTGHRKTGGRVYSPPAPLVRALRGGRKARKRK